jgi:hypothetical protein
LDIFQKAGESYNPPRLDADTLILQKASSFTPTFTRPDEDSNAIFLEWWYRTLERYLQRDITYHSDRLPAIAGLARACAERMQMRYCAGLWVEDLRAGLLWDTKGRGTNNKSISGCPSWNWAAVEWNTVARREGLNDIPRDTHLPVHDMQLISVSDICRTPLGEIHRTPLIVLGNWRCLDTTAGGQPEPFFNRMGCSKSLLSRLPNEAHVESNWDIEEERIPPGRIICSLDDQSGIEAADQEDGLVGRGIIYFQISKWTRKI